MSAGPEPSPPGVRRSIGEVVSLLRPEFSDLTDSKIRFLEDRKLISPSRTPGGYRSFGPHDIEVLRWILTRQRDQYLPLSVIGERIDRGEHLADIWGIGMHEIAEVTEPAVSAPEPIGASDAEIAGQALPAESEPVSHEEGAADAVAEAPDIVGTRRDAAEPDAVGRDLAERTGAAAGSGTGTGTGPPWIAQDDHRTYTAAELSAESGLSADEIAELISYGLLVPLEDADAAGSPPPGSEAVQAPLGLEPPEARYGSRALLIARISREFATYGLQARHLRVMRNAAARDASMFEQVVQPILHAGGAAADADAQRSLGRLVALSERLRSVVIGDALRRYWQ